MKTRIISGIVMVPLALVLYFGGIPLIIAALIIAFVGTDEFYKGWKALGVEPCRNLAFCMTALLYIGHFVFGPSMTFIMAWTILSIILSMVYGWDIVKRGPYDAIATMCGILYIVLFSYHIVLIDTTPYRNMIWLVALAAFGSDVMAYFTGVFLGKHKMAPNLSPKKTIEGAIGGIAGSAILCGLFGKFVMPEYIIHCMLIGVLGALVAMSGDLTASAFKRKMGIKDYGNLIPGHGGIMDRFDSIIFVAPAVYYYIALVMTR